MCKTAAAWLGILAVGMISAAGASPAPSDPMRPDFVAPKHSVERHVQRWHLSSTLISSQRRLAVVNGRTVGVGDTVDGARVLTILPYAVKLKNDDRVLTVYLVTSNVKRR